MSTTNLTLGPLVVNPLLLSQICKADGSLQVAQVDCFVPALVTIEYARLFSAAPELLASLIELESAFCGPDGPTGPYEDGESFMVDRARAAIAKATGSAA